MTLLKGGNMYEYKSIEMFNSNINFIQNNIYTLIHKMLKLTIYDKDRNIIM